MLVDTSLTAGPRSPLHRGTGLGLGLGLGLVGNPDFEG